ncbi:MAG TPA: tRNA lysidine(34) synthetase TilS [Solirubrobacteraceae bacterium]|nr:tRNA lysidine(34) synthetase TilS [Solirubrobacteraceae bacterium]
MAAHDLLERVRATGLLAPGAPVVVLLSGGRDSVCLLDVAARLAGPGAVAALHVDYGLRAESAQDAEHCRALCDGLGVSIEVRTATRPGGAGNLQAWARDVRLGAAAALAATRAAVVATGHTASDQAETILYRLAASPGRRALLGMSERDGVIVRPLLRVTREETTAHCTARGLAWREDASNEDLAYARNRARADLVPALRALHPAAEDNVVRTAQLLREEAAVLDEVVATALAGRHEIEVAHLAALPPALARLVLRRLAEDVAGRLCARAPARLADVLALGDGALDLGDGARAVVAGGVLRVVPTPAGPAAPART